MTTTTECGTALTTLGYVNHAYSLNGNLTPIAEISGNTTMVYDWENRLSLSETGGTVASYLYYADNMKAVENVSGALTTIIWDGTDYLQGRS